ncbi:MAG: hypothetical protein V4620_01705 [Bacteroidota bacterium]
MKTKSILLIIFFAIASMAFAQEVPKDYFNKEVQSAQGATTDKIIKYLELDSVDAAMKYCSKKINKALLQKASTEIRKIYKKTDGGYVIVFDEGYNIYRYRYTNRGVYFLIDLYFTAGDANSKVVKVIVKDKATLDKQNKETDDDDIPPPPPELK